jgi:hypothetical protein
MPCFCCPCSGSRNFPIEAVFKLVACLIGIIIEGGAGYSLFHPILSHYTKSELDHKDMSGGHDQMDHHHHEKRSLSMNAGNLQHFTMYSAFAMQGLVEILTFYKCGLPKRVEYAIAVVAFTVEGLLFYFHLHGRNMLDIHIHILLVISITGNFIKTIILFN